MSSAVTLSARPSLTSYLLIQLLAIPLLLGLAALYTHDSGLDFRIADRFYDPLLAAFPWRRVVWLETAGHQLVKLLPIAVMLLSLGAAIAAQRVATLRPWRPLLWTLTAALCIGPTIITQLKQVTAPPCPWSLKLYGGYADIATQWFANSRAEAGLCLPSGHAGAGFALLSLYFAGWAAHRPAWRWQGLAIGVAAGLLFGGVRMIQGAHFLSHVLWSALVDWLVAALLFLPLIAAMPGRGLLAPTPARTA